MVRAWVVGRRGKGKTFRGNAPPDDWRLARVRFPQPSFGGSMQHEFRFKFTPSHTCRRCGRALRDQHSILRGMGLTCYEKSCRQGHLFPETERKHGKA